MLTRPHALLPVPWPAFFVMLLACVVPPLLAFNLSPSATLFNQLAALAGWGSVLILLAGAAPRLRPSAALVAMLMLALAPMVSHFWTGLPLSLALSNTALLGGATLLLMAGEGASPGARLAWFEILCWGLLLAGLLSVVVSVVQVFVPQWADGTVIARSGVPGRAVGNMRQPNHLASLLMWSCVAAVYLVEAGTRRLPLGRVWVLGLPAVLAALIFAVVLSGSRTGVIGVLILAIWGALDRRMLRASRLALLATPVMLGLCWGGVALWSASSGHALGVESRLAEGAGSPARLAILANSWALLKHNPLWGVGWGEFNLAWTFSEFAQRPVAFFDHCHNLPMQLAVELGLPVSLTILGLLSWSLWRAFCLSTQASDVGLAVMRRCAFMLVLMIGLHSLLEYPLWYAYFLLPTAFAFGLALGDDDEPQVTAVATPSSAGVALAPLLGLGGMVLALGVVFAVWDYHRVVVIYAPGANAAPLAERISLGQRSVFFSTQADYAAATSLESGPEALAAARRSGHQLIDARLMMAWAKSLHAVGDDDKARYVVDRLREFHNASAAGFLGECEVPELTSLQLFQCQAGPQTLDWRALR
ncbi:Wzy polymerase domain-containing protein [Paucibacter sp. hw1]|uniref:Wzy polymerase domain-containing protein n=2 Tax=Roseateles koreensis TaxID=2987526 RepID=A0ABT5KS03_9BURK|nr:Wzy polymerase domain-containing protein [Roseateles koreensis]